jgi:hypothetical protein
MMTKTVLQLKYVVAGPDYYIGDSERMVKQLEDAQFFPTHTRALGHRRNGEKVYRCRIQHEIIDLKGE